MIALALSGTVLLGQAGGLETVPLATRSQPAGSTMFTAITPQQSGVVNDNPYTDPKMWAERYQEFALGSMGTGIAAGDFDHDGRPDLFTVSKTGQSRLFRNLGGFKFEDVTEKAGLLTPPGGWPDRRKQTGGAVTPVTGVEAWQQGATFADVDNDGWLDLYVCRYRAPNLLFINQRNGTFKEEAGPRGLAIVDASVLGAFCDYDRDGWLDVYVQTNMLDSVRRSSGQSDYLLHNNGDGTFTDVTATAGIKGDTLAHQTLWWDYNQDGWPDLYVTNDFAGADPLYRNNRDGTFTNVAPQVVPHTSYSSMGADAGDVNNDGRIDLFVADMAARTHDKDQRGMAASRELLRDDEPETLPQFPRNTLFLNTGTGRMLEAAQLAGLPATDWTWSVRFEDLDNDGRLDLHVTNGMNREYQNSDLRERIIVAETLEQRMQIMRASPMQRERHLAYRNLGDLRFEEVGATWGLDQVGVSFGAAYADFDGDGDLDVVYANYEGPSTVLRNDSATGHRLVVALRGTRSNRFGIGATVRIETGAGIQVRSLMSSRGYLSSSEPIAHFGLGDDSTIKRLTIEWPSGAVQSFDNVAANQRITVTEPDGEVAKPAAAANATPSLGKPTSAPLFIDASEKLGLALPTREDPIQESSPQPLLPWRFNRRGPAIAAADLDRDGKADFVIAGTSHEPLKVVKATGGTYTAVPVARPSNPLPDGPLVTLDVDGDGDVDVVVTKTGTALPAGAPDYSPQLLLNDGAGGLQPAPVGALPPLSLSEGAIVAADFDHDGRTDLFIGARLLPGKYPTAPTSAWLLNRGGRFEDATAALAPGLQNVGMVTGAVASDIDGDGWSDLVLTLDWGTVRCFHNDQGRAFSDWSERLGFVAAGVGWWSAIASADFNGDGRPDFAVGNLGLNTPYQATSERPVLLYYGQFNASGAPLLVEAYQDGERIVPRRTRNVLGAKIPAIQQRFRRNDLYARASLADIVGEPALKAAKRFAASELRSGAFVSQADGTYRFQPFARIAQISPAQAMVAGDFDGDGNADVYMVQNSFAPIPSLGRFDGGLSQLLLGDGHGNFTAVEPAQSGLVVPGDAKGVAVADLDGDGRPDFLVTRNNATTLAFTRTPHAAAAPKPRVP